MDSVSARNGYSTLRETAPGPSTRLIQPQSYCFLIHNLCHFLRAATGYPAPSLVWRTAAALSGPAGHL